jgi:RNA polymerase sigma-70 factor (ECF subfamily)
MSNDEAKLIQRAKRGDPDAFSEIYDQCQPAIYRYILYKVGNTTTAEDLTSEVFVRLVEKIDRFTYRGRPLLAWLYTIARNLITDHHRRSKQSSPLELDELIVSDDACIEETIEGQLAYRRIITAISHLTEDQRQVIVLRFIEEMDNATVAHMLGKSITAIKALQRRGLKALRRILDQDSDS